jgi:hypothetical protein
MSSRSGCVEKPAAPGGNIKGYVNIEASLSGKWIEIPAGSGPRSHRLDGCSVTSPAQASLFTGSRFPANRAACTVAAPSHTPPKVGRGRASVGYPGRQVSEKNKFHSKMMKNGRWTVIITYGYGLASYVGDFATEEAANRWISTNSKNWPQPADKPK